MRHRAAYVIAALLFSAAAHADNPDSARGRQVFLADGCYECHGTVGQGSAAGARLAPDPLPAEVIIAYIRHPAGAMPPYHPKVLSDDDVRNIRAYLVTIAKPPASP